MPISASSSNHLALAVIGNYSFPRNWACRFAARRSPVEQSEQRRVLGGNRAAPMAEKRPDCRRRADD
jgi:hypothetical protein